MPRPRLARSPSLEPPRVGGTCTAINRTLGFFLLLQGSLQVWCRVVSCDRRPPDPRRTREWGVRTEKGEMRTRGSLGRRSPTVSSRSSARVLWCCTIAAYDVWRCFHTLRASERACVRLISCISPLLHSYPTYDVRTYAHTRVFPFTWYRTCIVLLEESV